MLSTKANLGLNDKGVSGKTDILQALNRITIAYLEAAVSKLAPVLGSFTL